MNLKHAKIDEKDIEKGLEVFSNDLVNEINLEIRDVMPHAQDLLYHFIGISKTIGEAELGALLIKEGRSADEVASLVDVLLWHGVIGLVNQDGSSKYIYDSKYNFKLLKAQVAKAREHGSVFQVNPAFWPALGIH